MGFSQDVAVTTNADFTKYAFEQQATNLLRGANTYDELHKGAVNVLCREIRGAGFDPAEITNVDDFKPELTYWVLWQVFDHLAREGNTKAQTKADSYHGKYLEQRRTRVFKTATTTRGKGKGLPRVGNIDPGYMMGGPMAERGSPLATRVGRGTLRSFDETVQDAPS